MAFKRYLIEIGQGVDMHGEDNTNAALKALRDATHHCCMTGINDIFQLDTGSDQIFVQADIYAPNPDSVHTSPLAEYLSAYNTEIILHPGGASANGLSLPKMGTGSHITIVIAVLTVYLNLNTNERGII